MLRSLFIVVREESRPKVLGRLNRILQVFVATSGVRLAVQPYDDAPELFPIFPVNVSVPAFSSGANILCLLSRGYYAQILTAIV